MFGRCVPRLFKTTAYSIRRLIVFIWDRKERFYTAGAVWEKYIIIF